jgi:hypothetical protein
MFGCFRRIGCAVLLLVLGAAGWHWRAKWMPKVKEMVTANAPGATESWAPVTRAGAARAAERIASLRRPSGPAYVNVNVADFAAYLLGDALATVIALDSVPTAIAQDGTLYLRTRIRLLDVGGKDALGPLARMLHDTEPLLIAGRLELVRDGLAQFRLTEVGVRDLKVPSAGVTRLAARWRTGPLPDGVAPEALPVILPGHVADLRIANGRVTLYKAAK